MNCEVCGSTEANFHFCAMYGLELKEVHMCAKCAEKNGLAFGNLLQKIGSMSQKNSDESDLSGIFVGAQQDPETPVIKKKLTSQDFLQAAIDLGSQKVATTDDPALSAKKRIILLEKEMQKLIRSEKYEDCAKIKEQIEQLKSGSLNEPSSKKETKKGSTKVTKRKGKKNESDTNGN